MQRIKCFWILIKRQAYIVSSKDLLKLIEEKDWSKVKKLLQSSKVQIFVRQNRQTLFLASSCVPVHIFEDVFRICPQQLFFRDIYGNTIVHNVLMNYDVGGKDIIGFLLQVAPDLAKIPNHDRMLPLHQALLNRQSPEIIRLLLKAFPRGLYLHKKTGGTPAQLFFDEWLDILEDHSDNFECLQFSKNNGTSQNDLQIIVKTFSTIMETHNSQNYKAILIPPVFVELITTLEQNNSTNEKQVNTVSSLTCNLSFVSLLDKPNE